MLDGRSKISRPVWKFKPHPGRMVSPQHLKASPNTPVAKRACSSHHEDCLNRVMDVCLKLGSTLCTLPNGRKLLR